jgi:hypothetical protein
MKVKPCPHPEPKEIAQDVQWCRVCGATSVLGRWTDPLTVSDPKRHLVTEPHDLPPHADRRAWETFCASMLPAAMTLVVTDLQLATGGVDALYAAARAIAAEMADQMMMNEWAARFAPKGDAAES